MSNEGKKVRVNYIGTFDDGTVFDSSVERGEPLEFTCMAGMMIPGFDAAVNEMAVGETKKVHIPALMLMASATSSLFSAFQRKTCPMLTICRWTDRLHAGSWWTGISGQGGRDHR